MTVLKTFNLSKKYNNKYAVNKVNMHIEEGDIYGFVGENGAGKTTILRMISGLINPSSGNFTLYDVKNDDKKINDVKKKMGAIVELVSINKGMNALDNLKYQCFITNTKKTDEELIELIKKVGLDYEQIKDKKVKNFSLGMRQRLGLAVTLISSPKFIMLDEPMNGLDPQGFVEIRETIKKLNKEGVTFLISSHILSELDKMCNKIGFISHGKLLEEITIEDLHRKSRKRIIIKTLDFIGLSEILTKELDLKEVTTENNNINIYDNININDLMKFLVTKDIQIESLYFKEDNIENYYLNLLMRGTI